MGKFTEYKLPLKSLPHGQHEFDYKLEKQFFANMEDTDIHNADLDVKLTVDYRNDIYDLLFKITGEVTLVCDRCMDDMQYPVDTEYHIMVKYGDRFCDDSDDLLEIPESDSYLNVAYMLYDTVKVTIPIKHVHPLGKCNRQMSALLRKHRVHQDDEDAELENELMDEIEAAGDEGAEEMANDPRWDALKGLGTDSGD